MISNHADESIVRVEAILLVHREVELSHKRANRGQEIIAIGRGYKNGTLLTDWRDSNVVCNQNMAEQELCKVVVRRSDIGFRTFTFEYPLFASGYGECDGPEPDCNLVNAVDGLEMSSKSPDERGNLELVSSIRPHSNLLGHGLVYRFVAFRISLHHLSITRQSFEGLRLESSKRSGYGYHFFPEESAGNWSIRGRWYRQLYGEHSNCGEDGRVDRGLARSTATT